MGYMIQERSWPMLWPPSCQAGPARGSNGGSPMLDQSLTVPALAGHRGGQSGQAPAHSGGRPGREIIRSWQSPAFFMPSGREREFGESARSRRPCPGLFLADPFTNEAIVTISSQVK